ncbi:nucleotidyltransferase family protein [Neiella marina]|uniref:Nucleotidyltransferase family protein n=2 Tax=Neiella holothuriorum TaxID=2870530 RepID=A0ABS7EIY2_9GAMM|nr:nucleotidyltransferase family protein [Neiella holothuriorum]
MILAAGRGERMRPLTDTTPKPMLTVAGKPLIVWHLERLAAAGVKRVIINLAHLGDVIERALADGHQFGLTILYSHELDGALETAGGIVKALPLLGDAPFWLVNGDVWSDWSFAQTVTLADHELAKLVLVTNPEHNPQGDFAMGKDGFLEQKQASNSLTYAGIGVYSPRLFADCVPGKAALAPLLKAQLNNRSIAAWHHQGQWCDVGTPQRLLELNQRVGA